MKSFVLPGFYEKFNINSKLVNLYKNHSEWFVDGFKFNCFYGSFAFNIWNGGRAAFNYRRGYKEDLERISKFYAENKIPIRLTFTNPLITEEHLGDKFCNMIAATLENGNNEILTASDILENYLRLNYPGYKFCSSTTKCLTNASDLIAELDKDYYQVCLDYNMNHNLNLLDKLNEEQKKKVEFLCNAICPPGCPERKEHYRLNGISTLNGGSPFKVICRINENTVSESCMKYSNNISPEEIGGVFEMRGFKNFKLEGRTLPDNEVLLNYARYLIKPEYRLTFLGQF